MFCGLIRLLRVVFIVIKRAIYYRANYKFRLISFVANSETMGNRSDSSTMDYFQGVQYPQLSLIIPYLKKLNQKVEVLDWQDENIDWSTKNKIIFGPVWGYTKNIDKFMSWLDMIEKNNTKTINHPRFLKWNVKKNYLLDLRDNKIEIPNTLIIDSESMSSFEEARDLFRKNIDLM